MSVEPLVFRPSAAERWLNCPGSVAACAGLPEESNDAALWGTACHELAAGALRGWQVNPLDFDPLRKIKSFDVDSLAFNGVAVDITDEMRELAAGYAATIIALPHDELYIEQRIDLSEVLDLPGQSGTADAIVIYGSELQIHDLKTGRGVRVGADENAQLLCYAAGVLEQAELTGQEFETVRLVIHQPRLGGTCEWVTTAHYVREVFVPKARAAAAAAMQPDAVRLPSEKACQWCRAKARCPELAEYMQATVGADFNSIQTGPPVNARVADLAQVSLAALAEAGDTVALIEAWCRAVRGEIEGLLLKGVDVPGWKLVQGRQGPRAWADEKAAEVALKAMRIKREQMYDEKLISPTTAEKLAQSQVLGERQWKVLQAHITRRDGALSIAPQSDPRPAVSNTPASADFDNPPEATQCE